MTSSTLACTLLAQSASDCKRKVEMGHEHAATENRESSFIGPLGVCRALPYEQRYRPRSNSGTSGACGVRTIHPFRVRGGVTGVHRACAHSAKGKEVMFFACRDASMRREMDL